MMRHLKTKEFWQGVVSIAILIVVISIGAQLLSIDNADVYIKNAGVFAPLLFIAVKAAVIVVAPLTGQSVYLLAAPLFGYSAGFIYLFIGDILGYTVVFLISRYLGRRIIKNLLSENQLTRVDGLLSRVGTWQGFATARLLLLGLADITSYAAGLTHISFLPYILVTVMMVIINITFNLLISSAFITDPLSFAVVVLLCASFPFVVLLIRHVIMKRIKAFK